MKQEKKAKYPNPGMYSLPCGYELLSIEPQTLGIKDWGVVTQIPLDKGDKIDKHERKGRDRIIKQRGGRTRTRAGI